MRLKKGWRRELDTYTSGKDISMELSLSVAYINFKQFSTSKDPSLVTSVSSANYPNELPSGSRPQERTVQLTQ